MNRTIGKIKKSFNQLTKDKGSTPSTEELAERLGMPAKAISETLQFDRETASLDAPVATDGDDGSLLSEFISDPAAMAHILDFIERDTLRHMRDKVLEILNTIPHEKAREVLKMRLGIGYEEPLSFAKIGTEFQFSAQRAEQLERKARAQLEEKYGTKNLSEIVAQTSKHELVLVPG